jgi:dihydroorotate dehydrogenase (fumarate)
MNLATSYLGLNLSSPFIVGASPFCDDLEMARRLQDAGASALVMRSLFAEQIPGSRDPYSSNEKRPESAEEFFDFAVYQLSPDEYLRQLEKLRNAVTIPVIASLNGNRPGSWTRFAPQLEAAGAAAIELNFYQVVTDPSLAADAIETSMLEVVNSVTSSVLIPVSAKLSPFHSSIAQLAVALELAGAAGVVLFNRFYQPDIDPEDLSVHPVIRLSDPGELLLRLRWLAIVSPLLRGSLSVSGGVHTSEGVVKSILAGAHTVQLVSALLKNGPQIIATLREGTETWMRTHGFAELNEFRGLLNHQRCADPAAFERANYIRTLQSWKL